ncbi:MAG: hypothetical protein KatS3mg019_2243 [Fimbriimonadales bacterium]|nr:MAG: hypothetical protein KatS3mg019_2243 [Fimbriimonadales bacterium]
MVAGYDLEAQEIWQYAKWRALREKRALSIDDLVLGALAVLKQRQPELELPEEYEQQIRELTKPDTDQRVPVDDSVREFHAAVRWHCETHGVQEASLGDVIELLRGLGYAPFIELEFEPLSGAPSAPPPVALPPEALRSLEPYTINLTQLAAEGKLSYAYERDAEREALVLGLLSRTKPNVALVGPAGVGKTKLVEDLALRVYQGEIPRLKGYTVLQLDLIKLRAGTHVHGELEQRFDHVRNALEKYGDRIILFIDELHTIVGTQVGGHTLDVANALKPMLAAGKIRCIGATTRQEYIQYIESDRALARRFQMVSLQEPSRETMRRILRESRAAYERYHDVQYPDETLEAILDLSDRFLMGRAFPDKAFDVLDAAGAWASLHKNGDAPAVVTVQAVYNALAKRLQIPLEDLLDTEPANLEAQLNSIVLGQETAIRTIVEAIESGYRDPAIASGVRLAMIFVGPPNTGKTLTARALAELLCRNEKALLELDLSLMERRYSLSQDELDALIGVKPPYIGWERGGKLTNHVLEYPRCVIYVRHIERASDTIVNLFRQILEEGVITDGRGQHVNFREAIVIFAHELNAETTSRAGFRRSENASSASSELAHDARRLEASGFPETILQAAPVIASFHSLTEATLVQIARRALEQLRDRLQQMDHKSLEYDEALIHQLVAVPENARWQPDAIQRWVQTILTTQIKQQARSQPSAWANAAIVRLMLPPQTNEPKPPQPRVLVIDDVPDFYDALKATFPDWQWRWAKDESHAEVLLTEFLPHLALIDVCLSELDPNNTQGVEILQRLKKRFPQQTFILASAHGGDFATTRDAFRAGAYDYLLKGEHSLLQELVNSLVQREYDALKSIAQKEYWRQQESVVVELIPVQTPFQEASS